MKVVQVVNSLIGGGAERVVIALAKAFAKEGHDSVIVVFNTGGAFEDPSVEIVHVQKDNAWQEVKALGADLVLAHMKTPQRLFQNIYEKNLFFVIHNTQSMRLKKNILSKHILYRSRKKRLRKLYHNHQIITVSKGVEKDLIEEIGVVPGRIQTIYNPFDIREIQETAKESLSFKKPYIINVAGLRVAKRQDVLLKAFAKANIDLDLVILGEGRMKEKLQKLCRKLGIEKRVHFMGWQDNPYAWIKHAELFVLSSEFEGFGNVLVESLIVHTPVVSTDCPSGPDEILNRDLKRFLAKTNDPDDLAQKIEDTLSQKIVIKPLYYARFQDTKIAQEYLNLVR